MCPDCEARRKLARDAWINANISEAAKHIAKGAAEMAGLKEKTGRAEMPPIKNSGSVGNRS